MLEPIIGFFDLHPFLMIILLTLIPTLELRASIPYGLLATDLNWAIVFLVAVAANMLLGVMFFPIIDQIIRMITRIKIFNKWYSLYITKTQKKIHKYVDRYGEFGVALFIAIPFPGSGTYSGAIAAYLMGMRYRQFIFANAIGVFIAGMVVMMLVLSGTELFSIFMRVPAI